MHPRFTSPRVAALALVTALASPAAIAHPGHDVGANFVEGLMHPLGGLDHLLMIIAVSAWASLLAPRGRVFVAASLAAFVGIGALLPVGGGAALEAAIALTVVGAGMLLALGRRWPLWATGLTSAAFALIHGFAHGAEGPAQSAAYVTGLIATTAVLALLVSFAAASLQERRVLLRIGGALGAAAGAWALAG